MAGRPDIEVEIRVRRAFNRRGVGPGNPFRIFRGPRGKQDVRGFPRMTRDGVVRVAVAEEILPREVIVSKEVAGRSHAREDDGERAVRLYDLVVNEVSLPPADIRVDRDDSLRACDLERVLGLWL